MRQLAPVYPILVNPSYKLNDNMKNILCVRGSDLKFFRFVVQSKLVSFFTTLKTPRSILGQVYSLFSLVWIVSRQPLIWSLGKDIFDISSE